MAHQPYSSFPIDSLLKKKNQDPQMRILTLSLLKLVISSDRDYSAGQLPLSR